MQGDRLVVVTLLFAAALALSGCEFAAGSGGSVAPRAQESLSEQPGSPVLGETERLTEVPAHSRLMVTVEEEPFTLSDLEALPRTQISAAGETYEGVAIHDLLAAAQITDVLTITLVARDTLTVEVSVPTLTSESILAFAPNNDALNAVLPQLERERWLRDVVVIDAAPAAHIALRVEGALFAQEDLRAMPALEVESGDETYEGMRILDLLRAAGVGDAATVVLVDRQGESVQVPASELTADSLLAADQEDRLQAVLPGLAERYWLSDVVEIRTTP